MGSTRDPWPRKHPGDARGFINRHAEMLASDAFAAAECHPNNMEVQCGLGAGLVNSFVPDGAAGAGSSILAARQQQGPSVEVVTRMSILAQRSNASEAIVLGVAASSLPLLMATLRNEGEDNPNGIVLDLDATGEPYKVKWVRGKKKIESLQEALRFSAKTWPMWR